MPHPRGTLKLHWYWEMPLVHDEASSERGIRIPGSARIASVGADGVIMEQFRSVKRF